MATTSELDLEAIEARANAATPGPWGVLPSARSNLAHVETQEECPIGQGVAVCSIPKRRMADADFIAASRTDVPALCRELRAARQRIAELEGERDAWREYAEHAEHCVTCAQGGIGHCWEGKQLRNAAATPAAREGEG